MELTVLFVPEPNALHVDVVGFHFAILFAEAPPAVVNCPPTYTLSFESIAMERTVLFIPVPNALHVDVVGFHFAILFLVAPPALVNPPPTYTLLFESTATA